ncbi:hypothetical protein [Fluviicola taffensis]|uniref:Uncharacterized protein n=1 Tax=Fluviicola taffensis (strain DSM 16823 / NCIMB 13979 / RW262) TaxID=755732 RepID=F2ICK9_FLUTR|nr:hypothetical protein [Fluviicola taffensis]AEA42236.1 hypothetical protein Fluta_0227 [Fluviicola taffensis DSM 16823]
MIRHFIILSYLLIPVFGFSKSKESLPSVWIIKDSISKSIHKDSVKLVFTVHDYDNQLMLDQHPAIIQMKTVFETKRFTVSAKKKMFQFTVSKNAHRFQFFINSNFEELLFNHELTGGHYYEVGLNFQGMYQGRSLSPHIPPTIIRNHMVEKPVIYLYSESEQNFNLKIKTDANIQFTYPFTENEWKGTSSSNGTIQVNGLNYPYLFWDAALPAENLKLDWLNADQTPGKEIVTYLDRRLDNLGFNAKEKTDFITYWAPRIEKMKYVQLIWLQDEAINSIASLEVSPNFQQNRIYLIFKETDQIFKQPLNLKVKSLKPMNRTGNYLVEWGGIQIQSNL